MRKRNLLIALVGTMLWSCERPVEPPVVEPPIVGNDDKEDDDDKDDKEDYLANTGNKYEPKEGKCYVFAGQSLNATGGFENYTNGYCDNFEIPAGITTYLGFGTRTDSTFIGLYSKANWGAGDLYMDAYIQNDTFDKSMIAIGLDMVKCEEKILQGTYDKKIAQLGNWIKDVAPRPIFLRIGYEFDGAEWNFYKPASYVLTYKYIKDFLDEMQVDNVAYVWQSKGYGTSLATLETWYPGDEYVDWCGYSHFSAPTMTMIEFARAKGKPVFIAEATPVFDNGAGDADIKKTEVAQRIWDEWMINFFQVIEENSDVVKAFSYINAEWMSEKMWKKNQTFKNCDSRIQENEYVSYRWTQKMSDERYLQSEDMAW